MCTSLLYNIMQPCHAYVLLMCTTKVISELSEQMEYRWDDMDAYHWMTIKLAWLYDNLIISDTCNANSCLPCYAE